MKHSFLLLAGLAAASLSTSAFAGEGSGGFLSAEAGNTNLSIPGAGDDNDTAYGVRGGYFFNANWGVEGFYTKLGDESVGGVDVDLDSYGVGLVGKKNMDGPHDGFFIAGRIGVARTTVDVNISGLGSASDSSNRVYVGAAAGYDFSKNLGLSLNVNHQRPQVFNETLRVTTTTLALEYRF